MRADGDDNIGDNNSNDDTDKYNNGDDAVHCSNDGGTGNADSDGRDNDQ